MKIILISTLSLLISISAFAKTNLLEQKKSRKPSSSGFGQVGSPKKVSCDARLLLAKKPITKKTDINTLLEDSTEVELGSINPSCAKYEGDKSGTCEAVIDAKNIYIRYAHNTQNGNVTIEDKVTGQSTWHSWTNQHEVTKSGYIGIDGWLTNTSGGVGGDKRGFQVEFTCRALPSDW